MMKAGVKIKQKQGPRAKFTLRLSRELLNRLTAIGEREQLSVNDVMLRELERAAAPSPLEFWV